MCTKKGTNHRMSLLLIVPRHARIRSAEYTRNKVSSMHFFAIVNKSSPRKLDQGQAHLGLSFLCMRKWDRARNATSRRCVSSPNVTTNHVVSRVSETGDFNDTTAAAAITLRCHRVFRKSSTYKMFTAGRSMCQRNS